MCDNLLKPPAERAAGGRTWQDVRNPSQKGCCVSDSEVTYIYIYYQRIGKGCVSQGHWPKSKRAWFIRHQCNFHRDAGKSA